MHYVDTSALAKLVVAEEHSAAMVDWTRSGDLVAVTSDLTRTELMRAVTRVHPDRAVRARAVLDALEIVSVTRRTFDEAGRMPPAALRSLDAIHLAVALSLGDELEAFVTYDERLRDAALAAGLPVMSPGVPDDDPHRRRR